MKPSLRLLQGAVLLLALAQAGIAQTAGTDTTEPPPAPSALDAELFYELLLGELNVQGTEPAAGFALVLDAARRTNDPALYQRAVEIAFQGRSGDAALQAARAWKQAFPASREANRYVLQILLALNRVAESAEPLKAELALTDPKERGATLGAIPRLYARVSDKKLAANVVEQALAEALADRT
ncbi:MAG: tetratricopeptide repeat protein, partial [Ramlibacter sp.]